ncbi:unnamed protein product [Protopolystoma xenopodis]|uniref:Uncharacterized protein n=1 Tax=Protopolystoma xenopodis TaxID=117903 RepID=A0A3S5CFJ9_9PLAT|nr:unnamed protein product [Protopolystoma xenopodis]
MARLGIGLRILGIATETACPLPSQGQSSCLETGEQRREAVWKWRLLKAITPEVLSNRAELCEKDAGQRLASFFRKRPLGQVIQGAHQVPLLASAGLLPPSEMSKTGKKRIQCR